MLPYLVRHLGREPGPGVIHREHHADDIECGVEHPPQQAQCVAELAEALQRVVLTLNWDQHRVGGSQAVYGE